MTRQLAKAFSTCLLLFSATWACSAEDQLSKAATATAPQQLASKQQQGSKAFEFARPPVLTPDAPKRMLQELRKTRKALVQLYSSNNSKDHARLMLGLLRYAQSTPIFYLVEDHEELLADVKQHGTGPFLSYIIFYAYRLAFSANQEDRQRYEALRSAYKADQLRPHGRAPVFLKARSKGTFRAHSENAGRVVAFLVFSRIGEKLAKARIHPEQMLRIAALQESCSKERNTDRLDLQRASPSFHRTDTCMVLVERIRDQLGQSDFQEFNTMLGGVISSPCLVAHAQKPSLQ